MANRYWVGGTGNWSDDVNHWAISSGGSPANGNLPTSSDDVFIDSNSGFGSGGIITLDVDSNPAYCHDFICSSGHTFTIIDGEEDGRTLNCSGSFTLESGITFSPYSVDLVSTSIGETITLNGATLGITTFYIGGDGGGEWTLQDDLTFAGTFYFENGTFDANDHNVTADDFYFYADTDYTPTIVMGSGTWEVTDVDGWVVEQFSDEIVTITPETSTIKLSQGIEGGTSLDFYDDTNNEAGKIYHNLWLANGGEFYIAGSNTFNDFKIDQDTNATFQSSSTQIVSSFTAIGSVGNLIILHSSDDVTPTQFTLSKSSGIVECDYLDISNSNATGGAEWHAGEHSINTTNNDGWGFSTNASINLIDSNIEIPSQIASGASNFLMNSIFNNFSIFLNKASGSSTYADTTQQLGLNLIDEYTVTGSANFNSNSLSISNFVNQPTVNIPITLVVNAVEFESTTTNPEVYTTTPFVALAFNFNTTVLEPNILTVRSWKIIGKSQSSWAIQNKKQSTWSNTSTNQTAWRTQ